MKKEQIILGIDPGTTLMGYGILKIVGKTPQMEALGVIDLKKFKDHYDKLQHIFMRVLQLVEEYRPDSIAIEAPFYGKNVQSMLKLGRAQGVAMAAGLFREVPIFEYSPRKIKQAITGNGSASKEQVAGLLKSMLKLRELPRQLDATDGLAAAVCHHFQQQMPVSDSKGKSWKEFINKNPGRVV